MYFTSKSRDEMSGLGIPRKTLFAKQITIGKFEKFGKISIISEITKFKLYSYKFREMT